MKDPKPYRSQMDSQQSLHRFYKLGGERCLRKVKMFFREKMDAGMLVISKDMGFSGRSGMNFAMEVGFNVKSLSEVLGNTKTSTTLDFYVHSSSWI